MLTSDTNLGRGQVAISKILTKTFNGFYSLTILKKKHSIITSVKCIQVFVVMKLLVMTSIIIIIIKITLVIKLS